MAIMASRTRWRSELERAAMRAMRSELPETVWISISSGIRARASTTASCPRSWLIVREQKATTGKPKCAGSGCGTHEPITPASCIRSSRDCTVARATFSTREASRTEARGNP